MNNLIFFFFIQYIEVSKTLLNIKAPSSNMRSQLFNNQDLSLKFYNDLLHVYNKNSFIY